MPNVPDANDKQHPPIPAMVMVIEPGKKNIDGRGSHAFRVLPRKGDYIELEDDENIAYLYEVIAVMHPDVPTMTAADILAVRRGPTGSVWRQLHEANQAT